MADDEQAVKHTEGDSRDGEEVHRGDSLPVTLQKRAPPPCQFRVSRRSPQPSGNGSLRDLEPQQQELSVNPGRTPRRVLGHHPEDQIAKLFGDSLPPNHSLRSGDGTPIQRKSRSVPSNYCFWIHDNESLLPAGPNPARKYPEASVKRIKSRLRMPTLQHRELLTERQVLQQEAPTALEDANECAQQELQETKHEREL